MGSPRQFHHGMTAFTRTGDQTRLNRMKRRKRRFSRSTDRIGTLFKIYRSHRYIIQDLQMV